MSNYLLEIGVEEFPAKHINSTKKQFKTNIEKLFTENNFDFDSLEVTSTPRRFAILAKGIKSSEDNLEEKIKGPAKNIAFDDQGNPSKALQGFMRSKGISLADITYEELNGVDYVYAVIKIKTKELSEVLSEGIPTIIKNISNPRQMRWGGKNLRFLRPIRWIVSLLDEKVLDFDLEGIQVSNITKGHRSLGSNHIEINSIDEYEKKLEENYVIVSEKKRRSIILRGINRLSKEIGGHYLEDEDLLEELVYINEYPTPFMGQFDSKYLELPKEVIITPMKDHQRYFPVLDSMGNLLPYFISVRNGDDKGIENVIEGNRKVLVARLEDAKFFFDHDIKKPLEDYVDQLSNVGFYEGLGTMMDKTRRLEKLVEIIGEDIEVGQEAINLSKRAAYLSKADLVTQTVIEFTELQGVMGRVFAEKSGEPILVAQAIEEQYMPVKSGGLLPQTISGRVLSIADKLDTIAGLHSQGIEVTGSQDLYGQRRAALGILNILVDHKINMNLREMIKETLYVYLDMFGENFEFKSVRLKIEEFIRGRFRNMLIEDGFRYDIIDSIIDQKDLNVRNMYQKVTVIDNIAKEDSKFDDVITKYVRVVNIAQNSESDEVNPDKLEDEDQEVFESLEGLDKINKQANQGKLEQALESLNEIVNTMNAYLDNTHVMVDDQELRDSRLAMVKKVADTILSIFSPTKIVR